MAQKARQIFSEPYGKDHRLLGTIYYNGYVNCLTGLTKKTGRQRGYRFRVAPIKTSGGRKTSGKFPAVTMILESATKFNKTQLQGIMSSRDQIDILISTIKALSKDHSFKV